MKNIQTLLIILTVALFFTACEKDESPNLLSISGEVLVQDALTPSITTPLEDITVYLLNSPFTIDTTALWFTKTDVLDSTKTDANGLYKFSNLQAGNYEVMPTDTVMGYLFEKSANSDNIAISSENEQTDYTVNFSSPEVVAENSGTEYTFTFNNSGEHPKSYIRIHRKSRSRFLRMWWGKWGYKNVGEISTEKLSQTNHYTVNQTNTYSREYKDEFEIEFGSFYKEYRAGSNNAPTTFLMHTVENLKSNNVINVTWTQYTATAN